MAKNEVAVVGNVAEMYPVLAGGDINVAEVLAENLGGESLGALDLPMIKVPGGTSPAAWAVETIDGDEIVKDLQGILVGTSLQRTFYKESFDDGGGQPPDCTSKDCITGVGDPGGECDKCPYSQFGSADNGDGQACSMSRIFYMLLPGQFLPTAVRIPPSSLKMAKKYLLRLASQGLPYYSVITSLTLNKTKNAGGTAYYEIVFSMAERLPADAVAGVKEIAESLRSAIS